MKTNIFFRTVAIIATLTCIFGCTNPEVKVQKSIVIVVRPSTILSDFTAINSDDFEMYSNSYLRITCLIYDKNGNRTYANESLLDNFNKNVIFRPALDEESYTVVVLATCILGTLSSPTYEAYSISGTESLEQLRVEQVTGHSFYSTWSMMGYATQTISFDDSTVDLNLKPATALVNLRWQNIHAHDNDGFIYGKYSAKARDYWGKNEYSWTISVEKDGSSSTDVIVKDLSPFLYGKGFTSDNGCNIFKGKISGNILTIAQGQKTGCSVDEMPILLYGMGSNKLSDISLRIDNGKLTTTTMFGTYVQDESNGGWYELFNPGVEFTKDSSVGIDEYYIIYHPNNVLQFTYDGTPQYSSSLSASENRGEQVSPAKNTSSTNIYSVHNLFPGSSIKLFARTYSGNTATDYSNQTFTLVSGHQYVFDFDCSAFKLTPYEGVLGTRASSVEFEPIDGDSLCPFKHIDFSQMQFK